MQSNPPTAATETLKKFVLSHAGSPKQLEFWQSGQKWRGLVGGIGSGKTRSGAVETIRQPAGSKGMIVAPTYKMLHDSTMETFLELADPLIVKHDKTNKKITLFDGKTILYRSADEPDSLRGPNLGWFWLDEAALMERYAWDVMIGRLRLNPGRGWITTTPKGYDWIYDLFEDQRDVPDKYNYHLVRCSSDANIFLPEDYVASLFATYSGGFLKQEVGGEFTEWGKSQAYEFKREVNLADGLRDQYREDIPLMLCCDFNYLVKAWPVVQAPNGRPRVIGEVVVHGDTTQAAVEDFRDQFPSHRHDLIVFGDAAGRNRSSQTTKTDYQIITKGLEQYPATVRLRVQRANPPPRDRINSLNRLLRGDEEHGIPVLKIDAQHCPFGIEDLSKCHWNRAGTDVEKVTDPEKKEAELTHWTDGLGYWAWREFPFRAPSLAKAKARARREKSIDWSQAAGGVA